MDTTGELPENQLREDIKRAMDIQTPPPVDPNGQPAGVDSTKSASSWLKEVKAANKELMKFWEAGEKINNRFLDRRESVDEQANRVNLFTTNTQILISTLYAKFPKPLVTREWEDQDDPVGRCAANILERNLQVRDRDGFDTAMKHVVQDRLVPGLGQVWFRYEPTIVTEENPDYQPPQPPPPVPPMESEGLQPGPNMDGGAPGQMLAAPGGPPQPGGTPQPPMPGQPPAADPNNPQFLDKLVNEEVATDYVHWKDFIWSPCRIWEECRWVGRKVKMTKADVETRFGKTIAESLAYKKGTVGDPQDPIGTSTDNENQEVRYATVIEIWCKRSRNIYWVSEGFPNCLDVKKDPFNIDKFFPCPKPLFALLGTSSTVPRADYLMIQDQYEELDRVNQRITMLERAVKVVGVYDKTNSEIGRIFTEGVDNQMLASDNYSNFSDKGGFKGMMDFVPIQDIVNALLRLREVRSDLIAQIYELTGISDIMRGSTKASETLGAQQLKAQYGSVRLQFLQMEVASFVESALDIKAAIMLKMFQPETLVQRSNIAMTADKDFVQPALQLMKNPMFKYRVLVHADSMAVPEFNAERDARLQYLRAVSEFLQGMAPIVQANPGAAPYLLKMMQWGAAGFRVGRSIEGVLDEAVAAANKALAQPKPGPSPMEIAGLKKETAEGLLTTAKAVTQGLENQFATAHPEEVFGHPSPKGPPPSGAPHPPTVQ